MESHIRYDSIPIGDAYDSRLAQVLYDLINEGHTRDSIVQTLDFVCSRGMYS